MVDGVGFSKAITSGDASLVGGLGGGSSGMMMIELSQNDDKEDPNYNETPYVRA